MTMPLPILSAVKEAPPRNWPEYGLPDSIILPDIAAFFGLVAIGLLALLIYRAKATRWQTLYRAVLVFSMLGIGATTARYLANRPDASGYYGYGEQQASNIERNLGGEAPENSFGCWDCGGPTGTAYFLDGYMEWFVILGPVTISLVLAIQLLSHWLGEKRNSK